MGIIRGGNSKSHSSTGECTPLLAHNRGQALQLSASSHQSTSAQARHLYTYASLTFLASMVCLLYFQVFYTSSSFMEHASLFITPPESIHFAPAVSAHSPSALWGSIQKPYPTGAFWTNLVVNGGDGVVAVLPYGVKCLNTGVQVSYSPSRREITNQYVRDNFATDLEVTAQEGYVKHEASGYDELSVTMQYSFESGGGMRTPLVKGSPFITAIYKGGHSSSIGRTFGVTPIIRANAMQITNVEVREVAFTSAAATPRHWYTSLFKSTDSSEKRNLTYYIISLGNFQKWLVLFYSSDKSLSATPFFQWNKEHHALEGKVVAEGVTACVRVAIVPPQTGEQAVQALLQHGSIYPIGGHTTIEVTSDPSDPDNKVAVDSVDSDADTATGGSQRTGLVTYHFDSEHAMSRSKEEEEGDENTQQLLMLALPHHMQVMTAPVTLAAAISALSTGKCITTTLSSPNTHTSAHIIPCLTPIYSLKGKMTPVIGDTWTLLYPLSDALWSYPTPVAPSTPISTTHLSTIGQALVEDVTLTYLEEPEDPYTVGKALQRLAMLALIADDLGIASSREQALQELQSAIMPWLAGTNVDHFFYDTTYGGVVPQRGLLDSQSDYGSGLYNDHHFHYGYFIYTGAVLARLAPAFFAPFQTFFDTLARDVCNPLRHDKMFPFSRHKDMFDGHSWASGLFQQGNAKNQESSSEAVNAYYAVTLYTEVTQQKAWRDFAHILLTMEIQAVQTYWHISSSLSSPISTATTSTSTKTSYGGTGIYDKVFGEDSGMVGNVGALDVTTSTWFGINLEYVFGINILPLSPITAELFSDSVFLNSQYARLDALLSPYIPLAEPPTNTPTATSTFSTKKHTSSKNTKEVEPASECEGNKECAALGMQGRCCPTTDNTLLACCDTAITATTVASIAAASVPNSNIKSEQGTAIMTEEWESIMLALFGMLDPSKAWRALINIENFGPGNSKANSLLWAASLRPDYDRVLSPHEFQEMKKTRLMQQQKRKDKESKGDQGMWPEGEMGDAACALNSACDATGVQGMCCPAAEGVFLGCCPHILPTAS